MNHENKHFRVNPSQVNRTHLRLDIFDISQSLSEEFLTPEERKILTSSTEKSNRAKTLARLGVLIKKQKARHNFSQGLANTGFDY